MAQVKLKTLTQNKIRKIKEKSFPIISSARTKDALVDRILIPFQLVESLET